MRYMLSLIGLFVVLPSFVFAQTEGNIASYFANKKFDGRTITAFLKAAETGNQKLVSDYLTENPSIANVSDSKGNTALMYAAKKGNLSLMKLLANKGAKVNTTNDAGNSALCLVLQNEGNYKDIIPAVNFLINHNAYINTSCSGPVSVGVVDMKEYTPLHYAVLRLMPQVTDTLIKHGAKVNAKASLTERVGHSTISVYPLDMIFYANSETPNAVFAEVTSSMLNANAKFKQYQNSKDLLNVAIHASGYYDGVLDVLLSKKVIPNGLNSYKLYHGTPLTEAVCYGASLQRIKVLVKHGAKVTNEEEVKQMLECAAAHPAIEEYANHSVSDYLNQLGYK